jgi:Spy/CpxP family protein refolding chaperone
MPCVVERSVEHGMMNPHNSDGRCVMRRLCAVALAAILAGVAAPLLAQDRAPRRPLPQTDGVSPGEIQRLFDAYVVMQAQQELQLSDEQYPRFLARVKALQAVRQKNVAERGRLLQELRRLNAAPSLDESQVRARLKALSDLDDHAVSEVRDALAGIDQVLDLRQQMRFRLFEDQMERRKVDLLMRARQANRQRGTP